MVRWKHDTGISVVLRKGFVMDIIAERQVKVLNTAFFSRQRNDIYIDKLKVTELPVLTMFTARILRDKKRFF